jgi:restriction system protein
MIPTYQQAMLPVLQTLSDGKSHDRKSLTEALSKHFLLSESERETMLPSGKATVIRSRTGWAVTYLKNAGLLKALRRGTYEITPAGLKVLAGKPTHIDNDLLDQFESFRDFRARSRGGDGGTPPDDPIPGEGGVAVADPQVTPEEGLESSYKLLRAAVESELLDSMLNGTAKFFEWIVVDLLVRMGYGGTREEAARVVGKAGDEGIDGVIDEDRLGLDSIYVQAKKWKNTVERPDIQQFAGALQGHRATKGVFITTSSFSKGAIEYAGKINSRIVLIDGARLTELMFEHNVGVSPKQTYVVKAIDSDYFEEA